jgi:hypothetical protein
MSPGDAEVQPGYTPSTYEAAPPKLAEPVIHRDNKGAGAPPSSGDGAATPGFDFSGKGIDEILAKATESLDKQAAARAKDKKEAGAMRLLEAGLGMMGGTSPFAAVNIGQGATGALRGYGEDVRQARGDEMKDIMQRTALGLKGAESKADLAKLGIMAPLYKAQADYYGRRPGSTGSAGMGSVPFGEFRKLKDQYASYVTDGKSVLASPLAKFLTPNEINALKAKPDSDSYRRGMARAAEIAKERMDLDLREGMQYTAKQRVSAE